MNKSDIIKRAARAKGLKVKDFRVVKRNPRDMLGIPGKPDSFAGIFFMDELARAKPRVQRAIYKTLTKGAPISYPVPKGWRLLSARDKWHVGCHKAMHAALGAYPDALKHFRAFVETITADEIYAWCAVEQHFTEGA